MSSRELDVIRWMYSVVSQGELGMKNEYDL